MFFVLINAMFIIIDCYYFVLKISNLCCFCVFIKNAKVRILNYFFYFCILF